MTTKLTWDQSIDVISRFVEKHRSRGVSARRIGEVFDINLRDLGRWKKKTVQGASQAEKTGKISRLAESIWSNENEVLMQLGIDVSGELPNLAVSTYKTSLLLSNSQNRAAAVEVARFAFITQTSEMASDPLGALPHLLYVLNRHGTRADLHLALVELMQPALLNLKRTPRPVRRENVLASLGQIASIYVEGGELARASEIFDIPGVRPQQNMANTLRWADPSILRAEVRNVLWAGLSTERVHELLDVAHAHDESQFSTESVHAVRSEIGLVAGKFGDAWEAIEPEYQIARSHLLKNYNFELKRFVGDTPPRFFHMCTHFCYGVLARARSGAQNYKRHDLEVDLDYLEAITGISAGAAPGQHLGMLRKIAPVAVQHPELNHRLNAIITHVRHEDLKPTTSRLLDDVARQLYSLLERR